MDAQRWFELAVEKFEQGNYKDAGDLLQNAIQFDSSFTEAYQQLALAQIHQGQFNEALETYNSLLELEDRTQTRIKRAGLYLILEMAEKAEKEFLDILEEEPNNLDALKGLGDSYFRQQNFKQALQTYDKLLELDPDNAFYYYSKAETYYRAQDHEAAFDAIQSAIELEQAPEFFAFKGDFFIRHDNYERALEQYRLAANLDPTNAEIRMRMGFILRILDRPQDAIEAFDRALQIDPSLTEALENKIEILQGMGKQSAALASMEKLVRLRPEDLETGMELAQYYMGNAGYERASKIFELLIDEHYEEPRVWYGLAYSMHEIGQDEYAHRAILKAIEFDEDNEKYTNLRVKIEDKIDVEDGERKIS